MCRTFVLCDRFQISSQLRKLLTLPKIMILVTFNLLYNKLIDDYLTQAISYYIQAATYCHHFCHIERRNTDLRNNEKNTLHSSLIKPRWLAEFLVWLLKIASK